MWELVGKDGKKLSLGPAEVVDELVSGVEQLADREDMKALVFRVMEVAQQSGELAQMPPAAVAELLFVLGYRYKTMLSKNPTTYNGQPVGQPKPK